MRSYSPRQLPDLIKEAQRLINSGQTDKALSLISDAEVEKGSALTIFYPSDIQGIFDGHKLTRKQTQAIAEYLAALSNSDIDEYADRLYGSIDMNTYWDICREFVDEIWKRLFPNKELPPRIAEDAAD